MTRTKKPALFVRQVRVGSIWHARHRFVGPDVECLCDASFPIKTIERRAERPSELCWKCGEKIDES
jgi:hypothetical protein